MQVSSLAMSVVLETTIGDITVDLYLKERPNACLNFLKLCRIKYYNLCVFYKVENNFIAQTGDPTATGRGGESVFCRLYGEQAKYFDSELKPRLKHEKFGTLSMVNNGHNMIGSQFFLTLGENLTYLDEVHTVFGEVVEGFDILRKINEAICDPSSRPYQDIRITHTVVLHDPYDDPNGLEIPDASPVPTKEMLESGYIGADEEIDDTKGKDAEEIEEKIKESEAKARATILEMVGDLPDADVKPPENVLFVCKLNPVTTSEDLEVIFSRFGQIVSCEVIKDRKTGDSLQYAFIEFEKEDDCEQAYFKMDNVLIDDRRIHVDFSQSVSKLNWQNEANSKLKKLSRGQNLVIKGTQKKTDGYDMVFDMDNDSASRNNRQEYRRRSPDHRDKKREHVPYYPDKRSKYSDGRHSNDKYTEDNQHYSKKKHDYNSSSSLKSKHSRYEEADIRHRVSRSPFRKPSPQRSRRPADPSDRYTYSEKNSKNISHQKRERHDSCSSGRSVSPPTTKSSHKKEKYANTSKEAFPSKHSHKKTKKVSSPLHQNKRSKQRVSSSSSTSSSSESPSPVRKSSKNISSRTAAVRSRSPEPKKYKQRNTKYSSPSLSPEPSYRNKKSSKHATARLKSRSKSPEPSYQNRSSSKHTSRLDFHQKSPETKKKSLSKHKPSIRRHSSSPESLQSGKREEYSKSKKFELNIGYDKKHKQPKSVKTSKDYSDESSEEYSKQSKLHKSSYKDQHISKSSKHSHKETTKNNIQHKRRKRSSS